MRRLAAFVVVLVLAAPAFAVQPNERLADPVLEARARAISQGLRCLVCRNESIDESDADLAHDVRILLRQELTAGQTDAQAVQSIVDRYGQFVLLNPPVERATYVLWFGPPALLLVASLALLRAARTRRVAAGPGETPLSEAERKRLQAMMQESGQ